MGASARQCVPSPFFLNKKKVVQVVFHSPLLFRFIPLFLCFLSSHFPSVFSFLVFTSPSALARCVMSRFFFVRSGARALNLVVRARPCCIYHNPYQHDSKLHTSSSVPVRSFKATVRWRFEIRKQHACQNLRPWRKFPSRPFTQVSETSGRLDRLGGNPGMDESLELGATEHMVFDNCNN